VSVEMYYRWSEFVNCFHSKSCCVGFVVVLPCCLPIRAMSLLRSSNKIMLFWGLLWMWLNIVVCIVVIRVMSSMWVGMYRCIREYMGRGWFVILIICRYGDMLLVVGILEIFPGNVWFWCIRVSRPLRGLLYGWP
jgi:hypothetical protein